MGNQKFDWGEEVQVSLDAPPELNPGNRGSVCGHRLRGFYPEQIRLYLIEFSDGKAIEVPEQWLVAVK
jgi:hypothetical protein